MDNNPISPDSTTAKKLRISKKMRWGILIIVLVFILLGGAYLIYNLIYSSNNTPKPLTEEERKAQVNQEINQRVDYYSNLISTIDSVDRLKQLDKYDQQMIGEQLMSKHEVAKDYKKLLDFSSYYSSFDGIVSLNALRYCHIYSEEKPIKDKCLEDLYKKARTEGIIGANDPLPDSYFKGLQ